MAHKIINFYTREEVKNPSKFINLNEWNEFDSPEEAFAYMMNHKDNIVLGNILYDIEKRWKPLIIGGLKMEGHFIWNNQVFYLFSRFCHYVGEIKM